MRNPTENAAVITAIAPLYLFDDCRTAVRAGQWAAGVAAYDNAIASGAIPDAAALVYRAIALIRMAGDPGAAVSELSAETLRDSDAQVDLRRLVVSPLVRAGALEVAATVLSLSVQAWPESVDDRQLLASVLGRLRRWGDAIAHADSAAKHRPEDPKLQAARIQLRLQSGDVQEAAEIARTTTVHVNCGNESLSVWLTALERAGDSVTAARLAARIAPEKLPNDRAAAAVVRALLLESHIGAAIDAGERALGAGIEGPALRSATAQAYLARGGQDDRNVLALSHLERAWAINPDDLRMTSLYGEALLGAGRYVDAIEPLQVACTAAPKLEHLRATLARALRFAGRLGEAADVMLALANAHPDNLHWQRSAIAALSQAGRTDEADEMYQRHVEHRSRQLPGSFAEAMEAIDSRPEVASIPQARLDWAWSLRRSHDGINREQWERSARWGHLADHLLLEWLECRADQAEEAMTILGDLDEAERMFTPLLESGRGIVVATAHVGPMYAGLMALELLGIPSRWVASTPGISRAAYASALISTADQTPSQVAKECLRALDAGFAVCLAVDGAPNPSAPRIEFEGQAITYSSFAARAAYRLRVPSVFSAPRWENGKVVQTLAMLPTPEESEDVEAFAIRWQDAYLTHLREHLSGPAENLRLSGGLWRHIRAVDRSGEAL